METAKKSQALLLDSLQVLKEMLQAYVIPVGGTGIACLRYGDNFGGQKG